MDDENRCLLLTATVSSVPLSVSDHLHKPWQALKRKYVRAAPESVSKASMCCMVICEICLAGP